MIAAFMMNVTQRKRQPKICSGRRPSESMVIMQIEVPTKAIIALTAWKSRERLVEIPICEKIWGEKYWIALTPVIWQLAWIAMTRIVRRRFGQPRKRSRYVVFLCDRSSEICSWIRSYSANTYASLMSPYECNLASVRKASSARSWAQSHLNFIS